MKVVSAKMMSDLEAQSYQKGSNGSDFMENAGRGIAIETHHFVVEHQLSPLVWLLCGKGNNGGDAFVAGCYLLDRNYKVIAIQYDSIENCSSLCRQNRLRFEEKGGKLLNKKIDFGNSGVILDGLFGTGFKGSIREPYIELVAAANQSQLPILAVDIPSGLNGSTGEIQGEVIKATTTFFLGQPKTGYFLKDGWNVVGRLKRVDFGLPSSIIDEAKADMELLTKEEMKLIVPPINRIRHKYQSGYVVGLAGSPTMPGAALLSSLAAYRAGCGIVRLFYPKGMEAELSSSPYELIKIAYTYDEANKVCEIMSKAGAIYIGPGLGRDVHVAQFLKEVLPNISKPCVLDADALSIYAKTPFQLPKETIFTPHHGEMQSLLGLSNHLEINRDLLKQCQDYAEDHRITLILKGAPTFIFQPGKTVSVNPTGDPGMATAGSGDVLTGILAALLSKGLDCQSAAQLGVYLHGLAGECASIARGVSDGVMATDLINQLNSAYKLINDNCSVSSFRQFLKHF